MTTSIGFKNIIKKYGETTVIPDLSFEIKEGELFTLLGPSGCGKTTLLRMVAGFNSIEGGEISFNDQVINDIPAHKRNIGMVFQNYAIFPHMTVEQNVAYGLKLRKLAKQEYLKRLDDILDIVKISQYRDRLPENLSGGQQQRVALARAIVIHPAVLLMDEPLSNLDAKLRVEMRSAIREIQKQVGITTVYVTHDQEEALAISDRIAVMKDGVIQQIGNPREIYLRPSNLFVATFIGSSNVFDGYIEIIEGQKHIVFDNGYKTEMINLHDQVENKQAIKISVRPEEFVIVDGGKGMCGTVKFTTFLGKYMQYEIELSNGKVVELTQDINENTTFYEIGQTINIEVKPLKINVYNEEGEENLTAGAGHYEG